MKYEGEFANLFGQIVNNWADMEEDVLLGTYAILEGVIDFQKSLNHGLWIGEMAILAAVLFDLMFDTPDHKTGP